MVFPFTAPPGGRQHCTSVRALVMGFALAFGPVRVAAQIDPAKDAVPADPSKAWAAQTASTTIQLSWEHLPGIASYRVYCAIGAAAPSLRGTITAPTSIFDVVTGMIRRVAYSVAIRVSEAHRCYVQPVDAKGLASRTIALNEVIPRSKDLVVAGAPSGLVATQTAPGEVTVTWNEAPGATAYLIGRSVYPNGFSTICSLCPATTTFVDKLVKPGVKHTYAVTAMTAQGPSARTTSNVVTPSTGDKDLASTTDTAVTSGGKGLSGVTASVTSEGVVTVSWLSGFAGGTFEVLRSTGGQLWQRIQSIGSFIPGLMSFVDNVGSGGILTAKQAVVYKVRFLPPAGSKALVEELTSNEVIVGPKGASTTVAPTPPGNAVATANSATSVTLTWTPAGGVSQCQLRRSLNLGAYTILTTLPGNSSRFIDVAANLMIQRPRYQIVCGDPKGLATSPVNFTTPVWGTKGGP